MTAEHPAALAWHIARCTRGSTAITDHGITARGTTSAARVHVMEKEGGTTVRVTAIAMDAKKPAHSTIWIGPTAITDQGTATVQAASMAETTKIGHIPAILPVRERGALGPTDRPILRLLRNRLTIFKAD